MTENCTEVTVKVLPTCAFDQETAKYDGATTMGKWAYMCQRHFELVGVGLGTGKGQRLVLRSSQPAPKDADMPVWRNDGSTKQ